MEKFINEDVKYYVNGHREMWAWSEENPDKIKTDWPEWESCGGIMPNVAFDCFPCHYTRAGGIGCIRDNCLFIWRKSIEKCACGHEYVKWARAETPRWKSYWAKKIKELEINPKYLK